ncbi:MAG: SGNH/GDSL hydrolase family protein [Chloroflexi bacterium]|nr:SGNH/GDSL hydrolase family protein [Chloroflexota bacterium]
MPSRIPEDALVLFQGDSVTDAGRARDVWKDWGTGYAMIAASWYSALYPERRVKFLNRGVGGDRVRDLLDRWDQDFLALQPTWVSILIGINNTWRAFDSNDPTPANVFERQYRKLLDRIVTQLNAQIVLCDPFLLEVVDGQELWRPDLNEKIEIIHRLAQEYNTIHVPLDSIFAEASARRKAKFWLPDGVHPSPSGAALIAQSWLQAVGIP